MKKQTKIKLINKKTANKKTKLKVSTILPEHFIWCHFKLIDHKHSGKLVHFRHTSHFPLSLGLIILGLFLFAGGYMNVGAEKYSGHIEIGAIVEGPPPEIGAVITSPIDGYKVEDVSNIEISGTCPKDNFIVIKNNDALAGSTVCTNDGTFSLSIELVTGNNTISALNYDNLNQAGPSTPSVKVILKGKFIIQNDNQNIFENIVNNKPKLPDNPSIIAGKDSECSSYVVGDLPQDNKKPNIAVVCVPRLFFQGIEEKLGVIVWGGQPPYIVNINWGEILGETQYKFDTQGYHLINFKYTSSGVYKIKFNMSDQQNIETIVETAVQVVGDSKSTTLPIIGNVIDYSWFDVPVPLYFLALALTLGFWCGDLFDRKFGQNFRYKKVRKKSA